MENLCIFYASKYHLSLVLLEYLKNKNTEKYTVQTFLQNKLTDEIACLTNKYKLKISSANEVDFEETKDIKNKELEPSSNMIFIIEGSINYIKEANEHLTKLIQDKEFKDIKVINCYDLEQQIEYMKNAVQNNYKILFTSGAKTID